MFERMARQAVKVAVQRVRTTHDSPSDDNDALERGARAAYDFEEEEAFELVRQVSLFNRRTMKRALSVTRPKDDAESIALEIPELTIKHTRVLARQTVKEIKGISKSLADRIAPVVNRALAKGLRGEAFAKELQGRLKIERKAARRMAQGQVIRINSQVTEHRHRALGIEEYIWRSTPDSHTRKWHKNLDRTRQRYDSPPIGGGGGPKDRGNPGSADVCRCQAIPVIKRDNGKPRRPTRRA